jgi:hypothetical protein
MNNNNLKRNRLNNYRFYLLLLYLNIIFNMAFEKGHKHSKGRPPKVEEEKVNNIFIKALGELYNKETEDETKIAFVKDTLMQSQRGQLFIAEHIFGKPKEIIETTHNLNDFNIKDIFTIDKSK